jgi:hypothetical protein
VLSLGRGLVVSGRAEDDVVEAIELADGRWGLGVQWHPEANDKTRLFAALCDAARTYASRDGQGTLRDGQGTSRDDQRISRAVSGSRTR